ncbi:hypothetical protein QIG13_27405, partial [Klebsiella pneumoniae]|nr:hypothetical protein [Klebsiella pneumoniae]
MREDLPDANAKITRNADDRQSQRKLLELGCGPMISAASISRASTARTLVEADLCKALIAGAAAWLPQP